VHCRSLSGAWLLLLGDFPILCLDALLRIRATFIIEATRVVLTMYVREVRNSRLPLESLRPANLSREFPNGPRGPVMVFMSLARAEARDELLLVTAHSWIDDAS